MGKILRKHNQKKLLVLLAVFALSLGGYGIKSYAENAEVISLIHKIAADGHLPGGFDFADAGAMKSFYIDKSREPMWIAGSDLEHAKQALEILEASWTHGLNPASYHVSEIRALLDNPVSIDRASLEMALTDAAIRYGHDLTGMRVDPKTLSQKAEYWRQSLTGDEILDKLAGDPVKELEHMAPTTRLYRALQSELVHLAREEVDYDRVLPMDFNGNGHFMPGSRDKDVAALRVRLGVSYRPELGSESFYDDDTAGAVMAFQRAHGLEPDGIIGPQTLSVLNRTRQERMEQIIANLERQRWLAQEKPQRYILVNIPQQLLWAVEDGRVAHEMKVVVGMPTRKTKDFTAEVTGVRFNPKWTVPLNLKMQDFLPKLQENPEYLTEKGMEVIRGVGSEAETLDPTTIDWQNISRREMNDLRFVQSAGDHNALGRVRILMPNEYDIYLHDTNHPEFFERGQRTYSSGCIRLSEPEKVADFVLSHNKGWTAEDREAMIAAGKTVEVAAAEPFPVFVIYQSMWLDQNGKLVYGADVYNRDKDLIQTLARMDGYRMPDAEDASTVRFADASQSSGGGIAFNN